MSQQNQNKNQTMDKKKLILVIAGTAALVILVVACLLLWLLPGNKGNAPAKTTTATGAVSGGQSNNQTNGENGTVSGETGDEIGQVGDETGTLPSIESGEGLEPTVGVEIGDPSGNGGSGNTGNGGSGNSGGSGNQEIDFDDLLGN